MSGFVWDSDTVMVTACCISLVLASFLLTTVVAQKNDFGDGPGFNAPPLEIANLAFYTVLLLATLVQVICAISYLFRGRSPHLLPGVSAIVAFLILCISYALGIAITVAAWTFDLDSVQIINGLAYLHIDVAASLFFDWVDPAMFMAVMLVLRDRYRTCPKHPVLSSAPGRPLLLLSFTLFTCFLIIVLLIISSASTGIFGAAYAALYNNAILDEQLNTRIRLSNRFDYAFVAFSIVTTIFLTIFASVVKRHAKSDKIASATLFYIIPALCARALARLIFTIVNALLPLSSSWTDNDAYALDLASTVVYGVLFFIVASVLLYFLLVPRLWNGTHQQTPYSNSSHQQFAYALGSMEPTTQFPGQQAYSGQPQNYSGSSSSHPGLHGEYSYPAAAGEHYSKPQLPFQTASDAATENKMLPPGAIPQ